MVMRISKVYFKTEDNLNLIGLLHLPEETKPSTVVITTHGIASNCLKYRDDVIAKLLTENNVAYFTYNNRGHELLNNDGSDESKLQGAVAENILDSYFDIKSAMETMLKYGFKNIVLQGHSLGCTKTVYTYNRLLEENEKLLKSVVGISLLSMVDVPRVLKMYLGNKFENVINDLKRFAEKDTEDLIIEVNNSLPPVKPKTILRYLDNEEIDFFKYTDKNYKFDMLNKIKVPLFMRWGNVNELISIEASELVNILNKKITNKTKDINYIDKANHGYKNKEDVLASDILNFLAKNYLCI